jgi:hypothetical protein
MMERVKYKAPNDYWVVSTIEVEFGTEHDTIKIWNQGRLAGTLKVCVGDGDLIAERLASSACRQPEYTMEAM